MSDEEWNKIMKLIAKQKEEKEKIKNLLNKLDRDYWEYIRLSNVPYTMQRSMGLPRSLYEMSYAELVKEIKRVWEPKFKRAKLKKRVDDYLLQHGYSQRQLDRTELDEKIKQKESIEEKEFMETRQDPVATVTFLKEIPLRY